MEKKFFEAPYLKVVNVKNDIITGSDGAQTGIGEGDYDGPMGTQSRRGFSGCEEDWE